MAKYCEKDFQREFGRHNRTDGVFELKITKGKSIAFDRLEEHQKIALEQASSDRGCYHKISDASYEKKPFDCFYLKNVPAYVVIMFYEPRKHKMVYYVPIASWNALMVKISGKKSMREDVVRDNAEIIDNYMKK